MISFCPDAHVQAQNAEYQKQLLNVSEELAQSRARCDELEQRLKHLEESLPHALFKSWNTVGLLQGSRRPLPRKLRKKSEKEFPVPGSKKLKKSRERERERERVENEPKTPKKYLKNHHFDSFSSFFSPGQRGPGNPFSGFSRYFLGKGLVDPCKRPTMSLFKSSIKIVLILP